MNAMEREEKKVRVSKDEVALLDGEYVVVTKKKLGTLFIEARIRDDVEEEMDTAKVVHEAQHFNHCPLIISIHKDTRASRTSVITTKSTIVFLKNPPLTPFRCEASSGASL
jgi:hypothetical protein